MDRPMKTDWLQMVVAMRRVVIPHRPRQLFRTRRNPVKLCFTLLLVLTVFVAHGANCPYCGRTYGEGGSRDQAYIQSIRAQHEATCPERYKNRPSQPDQSPSGPSAAEMAEQQRHAEAVSLNNDGIRYWKDNQMKLALEAFRSARDKWPNNDVIQSNYEKVSTAIAAAAAADKKRQEEIAFNAKKQEALADLKKFSKDEYGMKGLGPEDNLGLKGLGGSPGGDLGLKGIEDARTLFDKGSRDSVPVDSRGKGPSRLDVPAAQLDSETLKNENYNKGFDALQRSDPAAAVKLFEQAQKERPNDPAVRNALLLAQDLVRVRQIKDELQKRKATSVPTQESTAKQDEDLTGAALAVVSRMDAEYREQVMRAHGRRSEGDVDREMRETLNYVSGYNAALWEQTKKDLERGAQTDKARQWALMGLDARWNQNDDEKAYRLLRRAHELDPNDACIPRLLGHVEGRLEKRADREKEIKNTLKEK